MISAVIASASARLVQRLSIRAVRLATERSAAHRRVRRRVRQQTGTDWRSATSLWPEFTSDITTAGTANANTTKG